MLESKHNGTRYIFITGGVLSGIGKGVVAASIGKLFQFRGYSVDMIKADPYLNVDPGTLNPIEHGEVFVCEEKWVFEPVSEFKFTIAEIDQDFGTYERFLNINMHPSNNITSGQIYLSVILKERYGEFLGRTIQVIPHITDEIKRRILMVAKNKSPDVLITEIGGTVGDIEAMPFLEAIRQLRLELQTKTALIHVTYVPYLETIGQQKTKPTQHSVRTLQSMGLQPDVIIARARKKLSEEAKRKISLFSNVPKEAVISNPDTEVIYEIPLYLEEQGLGEYLSKLLELPRRHPIKEKLENWRNVVSLFRNYKDIITIAMPGKYTMIHDSYISINEALKHAAAHQSLKVNIKYIDSTLFEGEDEESIKREMRDVDGILLTPGFGERGVEGMIRVAEYALINDIPFLGICFGAQLLFIAFYRRIMGLKEASSTEFSPNTKLPVVDLLPEQKNEIKKGGTMRLAVHPIKIYKNTLLYNAYKSEIIYERFRHRYHIIKEYALKASKYGLVVSAVDLSNKIINAIEVKNKRWIVGVQFHPEFKSRPEKPSPIYYKFVQEVYKYKK
ncbi:MAG: CTP synthase, partial [Candidatus Aenigmatarchaeota archaeon]